MVPIFELPHPLHMILCSPVERQFCPPCRVSFSLVVEGAGAVTPAALEDTRISTMLTDQWGPFGACTISSNIFFCSTRRFDVMTLRTATWRATTNTSAALSTKSDVDKTVQLVYGLYLNHMWLTHLNEHRMQPGLKPQTTNEVLIRSTISQ